MSVVEKKIFSYRPWCDEGKKWYLVIDQLDVWLNEIGTSISYKLPHESLRGQDNIVRKYDNKLRVILGMEAIFVQHWEQYWGSVGSSIGTVFGAVLLQCWEQYCCSVEGSVGTVLWAVLRWVLPSLNMLFLVRFWTQHHIIESVAFLIWASFRLRKENSGTYCEKP